MPERSVPDRNGLNFQWLLKLRWSSIVGQSATIAGVALLFDLALPLLPLACIVAVEIMSNLLLGAWFRRTAKVGEWHLAAVMALDVFLLTGLLYFTGGPTNPFSFLYLVNIALAAVVLHANWTWALVALSLVSFGLLLVDFQELSVQQPGEQIGIFHRGMWVAFGVAAGFIVHFLRRVTRALEDRERELGVIRLRAEKQERLASLATMAAGAAHELATPLGTIAVVAKEIERMPSLSDNAREDMRLIRDQVSRCRGILDQMSGGVGNSGELTVESVTLRALLDEVLTGVRNEPSVRVEISDGDTERLIRVPLQAVVQSVRSIVTNGQDASPPDRPVVVSVVAKDGGVVIRVQDWGAGMPPEVQKRVGDPFFTTKPPGSGMGLGVFLAYTVVERLGGTLELESEVGEGTTVLLTLPATPGPASEGTPGEVVAWAAQTR